MWLQDVSNHTPIQLLQKEQPRSILNEELKCNIVKISSRWLKRIYHLPYSEFGIRRYQSERGFGKTVITSSSGLRLTQIIAFWKGHDDAHAPTKDGPGLPPPGTDWPHEEADWAPPGPVSVHLLEASPPPRINLNHLFSSVWSYSARYIQFILITNAYLR
jgi:hypothetical protein